MKWLRDFTGPRLLWATAMLTCLSAAGPALAQARFSYSLDGTEVVDSQVGLVWRRCSAGQTWTASSCTGNPTSFTHEEALVYAQKQIGWRLPNIKELSSLVDASRFNPAIDGNAFPLTPNALYWSATPDVRVPSLAWTVDFGLGGVISTGRDSYGVLVRLVR